jgi:hypothetical protein
MLYNKLRLIGPSGRRRFLEIDQLETRISFGPHVFCHAYNAAYKIVHLLSSSRTESCGDSIG